MNSPWGSLQSYLISSTQIYGVPGISNHHHETTHHGKSQSEDWLLPGVLCVHFMRNWAQELFFDWLEMNTLKSSGSISGNSVSYGNSPGSGAHVTSIPGLRLLSRTSENLRFYSTCQSSSFTDAGRRHGCCVRNEA